MAELVAMFSVPIINDCIITPLKNHISYPFTLDSKLQRLRKLVEDLKNKRQEMQHSVYEAVRNGEQIYDKVNTWLSSAQKDIEEAEELLRGEEEAKKKCCVGFCPNLKSRSKLSKIAHKKALVIDEQLKNAQGLYPIAFRTTPPPIIEVPSGEALQSRVVILNEIVEALKDPDLNPIVVHGMGGIGKTTLAKEVQAAVLKLFDDVVFVVVSETPNLRRIQGDLADALGLTLHAEGDRGRAMELHNWLNNTTKQVLIIFDDVWEELDLYAIGIISRDGSEGCKIFLTSRKKNVLCGGMCKKKAFSLGLLEKEEPWTLFEKILNKDDGPEFLANNPEFCALAEQVVDKCGGFPLLIEKVATDLRNNRSLHAWKDMLKQLEDVDGTDVEDKVRKVVESSYNNLKDEIAKSLFLLCPLFGISNIRIQDLLIYCTGLGLFKNMDSIEESRHRVLTLIDELKNESLLLDGDKAGFVKIHDVVRDIAAKIASKEHCAFVGKGQIRSANLERGDCRRISLPYCEIHALPEVLHCPEAEVYSVFVEDVSLDIPASFFKRATKLKVLHFTGLSFMSGLPSSICFLTGLQTLSLDGCKLNNVAIVAQLKQLEVLSFSGSYIAELPREMEALTQLKLLDLTDCHDLEVIPSNVLSNLCLLEELYVLNRYDGWGMEGNASLEELKYLSRLTTLEIRVKDDKLLPEDWFFNGMQHYRILIGNWSLPDAKETSHRMLKLELKSRIGLMHRIMEFLGGADVLYFREVNGIENLSCDSSMENMNSFQSLRVLHFEKCDSLTEVLPFSSEKCLPHLQEMKVESCSKFEAIVGEAGNEKEVMEFPQLTSLKLSSLPNLRGFCRTSGTVVSFPNLTSLEIEECDSLKYVFTTPMVKSLKNLENLGIKRCESIEEIILVTKFEGIEEEDNRNIVFPELEFLNLESLRNLKRFSGVYTIKFLKLRVLSMNWCQEMKNFVSEDSDRSNNNESRDEYFFNKVTLPNLEIMHIERMRNLRYLWHQQFADNDSFSKLKSLEIRDCEKLSVVFSSNEIYEYEGSKEIHEVFSFENLQSVKVKSCPELKYVISASIACSLLELQELEIENC